MDDFDMGLLDDDTYKKKVLRQLLLGIAPVFLYRAKEKQPGEEYLADEWNLRKPLSQCSLRCERRGDILLVVFTSRKENEKSSSLFALCKIDLNDGNIPMEHYVQPVGDSMRYFAIRVTDEKGGREAVLGLGFREREEAADFRQVLHNYMDALARERLNNAMQMANQ